MIPRLRAVYGGDYRDWMQMPHPMFVAHVTQLEPLRAERLLDAAQAASVPHMGKEAAGWFERLTAQARGMAAEVVKRAFPMFTWNGAAVNTSHGLRQRFAASVSGGRVES